MELLPCRTWTEILTVKGAAQPRGGGGAALWNSWGRTWTENSTGEEAAQPRGGGGAAAGRKGAGANSGGGALAEDH